MLLAVVLFSLSSYWLTTRTFEPLDMPIRLDQGEIRSDVFEINLRERYYVNVVLDPSIDDYYEDRCNYKRVFGSQWKLYRQIGANPKNAELLVSWEDNETQRSHVGDFAAGPGTYQLEWQGPAGAGCLNTRFYVNGKQVPREDLRSRLEEELLRRGVWVVYFEADDNCLYMDAVYAMDTIQGLGAKMIWITPKTREEWKHRVLTKVNHNSGRRVP